MTTITKYLKEKGYSISEEYCGSPEKRFALRFRGNFISSHKTKKFAVLNAIFDDDERTIQIL